VDGRNSTPDVLPDAVPLEFDAALLARDEPVELILSG
jgi:hypothetical protein